MSPAPLSELRQLLTPEELDSDLLSWLTLLLTLSRELSAELQLLSPERTHDSHTGLTLL